MCLREVDAEWNITWPLTASGETAQQKCPGGAESVGTYVLLLSLINNILYMYV